MKYLHNMITFSQNKCLNRSLSSFYKYGRYFSTKNCYMRSKLDAVKYITCQRNLNIVGLRRFTHLCSLTIVNLSFSENIYISFVTGTKFPGQYKMSAINSSLPAVCMIKGSRSFFSGHQTWKYQSDINDPDNIDECEDKMEDIDKEEYDDMVTRMLHLPEMGHQVLVVQPYVKWGSDKKRNTTPELQLAEAVALVGTLPKWKVVDKVSDTSIWLILII